MTFNWQYNPAIVETVSLVMHKTKKGSIIVILHQQTCTEVWTCAHVNCNKNIVNSTLLGHLSKAGISHFLNLLLSMVEWKCRAHFTSNSAHLTSLCNYLYSIGLASCSNGIPLEQKASITSIMILSLTILLAKFVFYKHIGKQLFSLD